MARSISFPPDARGAPGARRGFPADADAGGGESESADVDVDADAAADAATDAAADATVDAAADAAVDAAVDAAADAAAGADEGGEKASVLPAGGTEAPERSAASPPTQASRTAARRPLRAQGFTVEEAVGSAGYPDVRS